MAFLDNHTNLKAFFTHIADIFAMVFGVSNSVDYISIKVNGYPIFNINPMSIHFIFQELFFYAGGILSIGWLTFRLLTQYNHYKSSRKP